MNQEFLLHLYQDHLLDNIQNILYHKIILQSLLLFLYLLHFYKYHQILPNQDMPLHHLECY
nr:MAG TPA: hypothetical protein [Bacteriophage sp.]